MLKYFALDRMRRRRICTSGGGGWKVPLAMPAAAISAVAVAQQLQWQKLLEA